MRGSGVPRTRGDEPVHFRGLVAESLTSVPRTRGDEPAESQLAL